MRCHKCGKLNNSENTYCDKCRAKLLEYVICPKCGGKTDKNSDVCTVCLSLLVDSPVDIPAYKEFGYANTDNPPIDIEEPISCPECGKLNSEENTYCDSCRARLKPQPAPPDIMAPSRMFCYNCGMQAEITSVFCSACGTALRHATPASPSFAPPSAPPPKPLPRPFKSEYVLGLIGSILGTVLFLILLIVGLNEVSSSFTLLYDNGFDILLSSFFALASFVLGFVGIAPLKRGKWQGGLFLTLGGIAGIIAIGLGDYVGWILALSFPLLLAGGIVALARRKFVERNYPQE